MIQPSSVFKENLAQMPAIDGIARIDLVDGKGAVVASIENKPGKQGSLTVYNYLRKHSARWTPTPLNTVSRVRRTHGRRAQPSGRASERRPAARDRSGRRRIACRRDPRCLR